MVLTPLIQRQMKIRSKSLFAFLSESGVLNGTKEDIANAKALYRLRYRKDWKERHRNLKKEIRFYVTRKEYYEIKQKAISTKMTATSYSKLIVLSSISQTLQIPNRNILESIRQNIGVTLSLFLQKNKYGNVAEWNIEKRLIEAEKLITEYLNQ